MTQMPLDRSETQNSNVIFGNSDVIIETTSKRRIPKVNPRRKNSIALKKLEHLRQINGAY